ncbi:MAG: glucose-6-phosphate isomerase [Anaerolineales bacterium]|nr:glucose-6-phosphate isomerase [Anaerolineales bacterium]
MKINPFAFQIDLPSGVPTYFEHHLERKLSAMEGQFHDQSAYRQLVDAGDPILYQVYEVSRPQVAGEIINGVSILHPGKVGDEYAMTKGHFHSVLETAEIYYCLQGQGVMVMETPEGDWAIEELSPGKILYVAPRWAHRSVNTGTEDLITFFAYPGHAGHDYGTIETQGFRKLVVEQDGKPAYIDNPRWQSPAQRG